MSDKTETGPNAWFFQCIKDGIVGADEESWARDRLASWMGQWESYNGLEDVAWIVMKAVREALEKAAQVADNADPCSLDPGEPGVDANEVAAAIRALGATK